MKALENKVRQSIDWAVNFISNRIVYLDTEGKDIARECIKNLIWWTILIAMMTFFFFLPYWYDQLIK